MKNLLQNIPDQLPEERFETLVKNENIHIERIVSKGHTSPKEGWYDQDRQSRFFPVRREAAAGVRHAKRGRFSPVPDHAGTRCETAYG